MRVGSRLKTLAATERCGGAAVRRCGAAARPGVAVDRKRELTEVERARSKRTEGERERERERESGDGGRRAVG